MGYEVKLKGDMVELVDGADGYAQEGLLTTFFQGRDGRTVLDCWARRLASYRTADIVCVHWVPAAGCTDSAVEPLEGLRWAV